MWIQPPRSAPPDHRSTHFSCRFGRTNSGAFGATRMNSTKHRWNYFSGVLFFQRPVTLCLERFPCRFSVSVYLLTSFVSCRTVTQLAFGLTFLRAIVGVKNRERILSRSR